MIRQGNYKPLIVSLKEARSSSDPKKGTEAKKLRLPAELAVVGVRKEIPDR